MKIKTKHPVLASLFTLAPLAAILAGCGAPSYEGESLNLGGARSGQSADDEDTEGDDDTGDEGTSKGKPTTSTSPKPSKGACAGETSAQTCLDCCASLSPKAVDVYTAAFSACACQSPGKCTAECGQTLCGGTQPDAACRSCLETSGCDDAALSACEKDASCGAFLKCSTDSGCGAK